MASKVPDSNQPLPPKVQQSTRVPFAEPLWHSRCASPYYSESHRRLQKEVRQYVDTKLLPFSEQWERDGSVPAEALAEHCRQGYMATAVYPMPKDYLRDIRVPGGVKPEDWGGFHDLVVLDEIARCGYLGVIWGLACGNSIGAPPLINFGTEQQKGRFLPGLLDGSIRFCLAVTEPEAGSDVAGLKTTAERKGEKYIVNGSKKWITNGVFADYATAAVRTGGEGRGGVSALVIPLKAPGACAPHASTLTKDLVRAAWVDAGGERQAACIRSVFSEMMAPESESAFGLKQFQGGVKKVNWDAHDLLGRVPKARL